MERTSLGDFISALYDSIDTNGGTPDATNHVVTAATLDLLLRQRNGRVIAALLDTPESELH